MFRRRQRGETQVGDIIQSQGVNFGDNATVSMTASEIHGGSVEAVDATALETVLTDLYNALDRLELPQTTLRKARTEVDSALTQGIQNGAVKRDPLAAHLKTLGDLLTDANVVTSEGSALWEAVRKLAPLIGPLVGGAHLAAAWFGIPLP